MKIIIDAINIREGGGLTYLINFLKNISSDQSKNLKITLYINKSASLLLPKRNWLVIKSLRLFDLPFPIRFFYQQFFLIKKINKDKYHLLFSPGGIIPFFCKLPTVSISQNLLPFELKEARLFGNFNKMLFKMMLLRFIHRNSFKKASGVIFLSKYAIKIIKNSINFEIKNKALIPHGIDFNFFHKPRIQLNIEEYSVKKPFKIIYTSTLMPYKHQVEVIKAIHNLRKKGYPINITLLGISWKKYANKVFCLAEKVDPKKDFIRFIDYVPNKNLPLTYRKYDAAIFASSCENLPITLLENMASGLPIVSSKLGPMIEVLGNAGIYFDPYNIKSIENAIEKFILNSSNRFKLASLSYKIAKKYSWSKNSNNTLDFFKKIINEKS